MDGDNSHDSSDATGHWRFQPGDTVSPGATVAPQAAAPVASVPSAAPAPTAGPVPQQASVAQPTAAEERPAPQDDEDSVSWSASEFIAHHKSFGWYAALAGVTAMVVAAVLWLTKDKITAAIIVFVAIMLGVAGARKPRTLPYRLDMGGLSIGEKFYDYGQFRSFAVVDEGPFSSIVFMPLRRLMPLITVYYDPRDEENIVGVLSEHLPLENHELALIDKLMRRIRF